MIIKPLIGVIRRSPFRLNKYSTAVRQKDCLEISNKQYNTDDYTTITPKILSYVNRNIHLQEHNPLSYLRQRIVEYFYSIRNTRGNALFSVYDNLNPVVSTKQNFDDLLIPASHPSKAKSDNYYINRDTMLRAHMTAHQAELIKSGLGNFLMIGDVYRRDEIDSTHFPVFHQVDGFRSQTRAQLFPKHDDLHIFEEKYRKNIGFAMNEDIKTPIKEFKQPCHTTDAFKLMEHQMKSHIIGMIKGIFGDSIKYRWVDAYFPFTHPSWELEVQYEGKWLEILGCGITRNEILLNAGLTNTIAYAFGLGLERLAMALYKIPDIRLFWSNDSGFVNQFKGKKFTDNLMYKPVSVYPQCANDMSFWLPKEATRDNFSDNDFYDLVRDVGGDVVEQVILKDSFVHPKTKLQSLCYRIVYRHMERTLNQAEVNEVHRSIEDAARNILSVTIR